jgi:hypothetical protein
MGGLAFRSSASNPPARSGALRCGPRREPLRRTSEAPVEGSNGGQTGGVYSALSGNGWHLISAAHHCVSTHFGQKISPIRHLRLKAPVGYAIEVFCGCSQALDIFGGTRSADVFYLQDVEQIR